MDIKKHFIDSFTVHKKLFAFVVILTVLSLAIPWIIYNESMDAAYDDAYLAQETFYDMGDALYIIENNVEINIEMYLLSIFFGYGAIIDIIVNIGQTGITSAATGMITGDQLLFIKFTLVHGIFEDASTILNSFAGLMLFYFIVAFIRDIFKKGYYISWDLNKVHLKQSLSVFIVALILMIIAGLLEEFVSVPIGDFIAYL